MTGKTTQKPITGKTVLAWFIGFFAVIFLANSFLVHFALKTFPGVVTARPYEEGLAYNGELAAQRAQGERDWSVSGAVERAGDGTARIEVTAMDDEEAPLAGLLVVATLRRPASPLPPIETVLVEGELGRYRADLGEVAAGNWILDLEARAGDEDERFRSRNRIFLAE